MIPKILLFFGLISITFALMMPDASMYKRRCNEGIPCPNLNIEWFMAQTKLNILWYSKNVQYMAVCNLMGIDKINDISESQAGDICASISWKDKWNGIVGLSNTPTNEDWVVHRNPYRPSTTDVTFRGEYIYSTAIIMTDNECFALVEMYYPDGSRGFLLVIAEKRKLHVSKMEMVRTKLAEMGYRPDQYVSVSERCQMEYENS